MIILYSLILSKLVLFHSLSSFSSFESNSLFSSLVSREKSGFFCMSKLMVVVRCFVMWNWIRPLHTRIKNAFKYLTLEGILVKIVPPLEYFLDSYCGQLAVSWDSLISRSDFSSTLKSFCININCLELR
jgi:hypothetical protein